MAFNIAPFLQLLKFLFTGLTGGGIVEAVEREALQKLRELKAQLPGDIKGQGDRLEAWLTEKLAPTHDVGHMKGTIRGIAEDLVNGTESVDEDAWLGHG